MTKKYATLYKKLITEQTQDDHLNSENNNVYSEMNRTIEMSYKDSWKSSQLNIKDFFIIFND
jgi:hypothetical protein